MFTKLTANDGHQFDCWMQAAEGEVKGGLVILQEIFGVTDQLKQVANAYAKSGFNVAIPALFDRQQSGAVVPFDQVTVAKDLMSKADINECLIDISACIESLKTISASVAIMGFCWGGGLAVRCAQTLDISSAVSFYGTRLPQYMTDPLIAPTQCHFGRSDNHTPAEIVNDFRAKYPEADVHMYEAGHAFANNARPSYVATAAERAHQMAITFILSHP
jgi:carboxymethylenebutenolidase